MSDFRPGVAVKGDLLLMFTHETVTAARLWPKPAGWRRSESSGWRHVRPDIDLGSNKLKSALRRARNEWRGSCPDFQGGQRLLPGFPLPWPAYLVERTERALAIYEQAFQAIPCDVTNTIRPFPERHFSLLSFAARCEGSRDLLISSPGLSLMLSNSWCFKSKPVKRPLRSARHLLRKKQIEILDWLDWPRPSPSAVRILRKLPKSLCTVETLLYLRNAASFGANQKLLSHVPRLNRGAIYLLSRPQLLRHVSPTLLEEVACSRKEDSRPRFGPQLRALLAYLADSDRPVPKSPFTSTIQFQERYGWFLEAARANRLMTRLGHEWPPPPVPGQSEIVPLTSLEEVAIEAHEQEHCILQYGHDILQGRAYVYKVLGEQRATALIRVAYTKPRVVWDLEEIRGKANSDVQETTTWAVRSWLASHQNFESDAAEVDFLLGRGVIDYDATDEQVPF